MRVCILGAKKTYYNTQLFVVHDNIFLFLNVFPRSSKQSVYFRKSTLKEKQNTHEKNNKNPWILGSIFV
jgi:hypothetical protein